jgi:maltose operon protein
MTARSPVYTGIPENAGDTLSALRSARVCCDSLDQIRFEALNTDKTRFFEIGPGSQAYQFSTGKSFLQAFRIPDDLDRATVTVEAIAGGTVFVPTVLVLDSRFRVTRAIESDRFRYTPAGFLEPQRLKGSFKIDRTRQTGPTGERYFLIFTTERDMRGSTQMISEARLYARARGLADPGLPDPVARHAAAGVIRVSTSDLETSQRSTATYVSEEQSAQRYLEPASTAAEPRSKEPEPKPVPAPSKPSAKAPSSEAQPMLDETQRIYDRMIRESVSSGDMDRAWRLVQEAERAGSTSARRTFVEAVERK